MKLTEELKSDIEDIFNDTSKGGGCEELLDFINVLLNSYSDSRIKQIKDTLKFVCPSKVCKIDSWGRFKTILEYSKLE
jgi:hypothetical protein